MLRPHPVPTALRATGTLCLPLLAWPGAARAQAAPDGATLAAAAGVIAVLVLFLVGAWIMLRRLAHEMQARVPVGPDDEARRQAGRLLDLPLGVPEGSIRALLSLFIIVLGFLMLALQRPLGLGAGEALTGFIGAVTSFYFAARSGEQARQVAETAADAARQAAGAADRAVQAGSIPAVPERPAGLDRLRDAQARLQSLRGLVAVVGGISFGAGPLAGADRALARIDGLLDRIAPVLGGQADAAILGRLAEEAGAALQDLGDLGPVGHAVADAMATVGGAAADSAPIANMIGALGGGALGGPAGLVAAVVLGGLSLVRDREKFDRWKAAMLEPPLDLGLLPPVVDANLAAAALLRVPLLARLAPGGAVEPALALSLWEVLGGQPPEPAASLAVRLLGGAGIGPGAEALRQAFTGHAEALAEAIEAFRAAMTSAAALAGLGLPQVTVAGTSIPTAALATTLGAARRDGRVAAEIERLVAMTEALGRADPAVLAQAEARLADPDFLAAAERAAMASGRATQAASTPGQEGGSG